MPALSESDHLAATLDTVFGTNNHKAFGIEVLGVRVTNHYTFKVLDLFQRKFPPLTAMGLRCSSPLPRGARVERSIARTLERSSQTYDSRFFVLNLNEVVGKVFKFPLRKSLVDWVLYDIST